MAGWTLEEILYRRHKMPDVELEGLYQAQLSSLKQKKIVARDFVLRDVILAEDFADWAKRYNQPVYHVEGTTVSVALTFHDLAVHERKR